MNEEKPPNDTAKNDQEGLQPPPWQTDPFELLQKFDDPTLDDERFDRSRPLSRRTYFSLTSMLCDRNGERAIAERLWEMASREGSKGAARALFGCRNDRVTKAACDALEKYIRGEDLPIHCFSPPYKHSKARANGPYYKYRSHPAGTHALAGTTDRSMIDLLQEAVRFQRDTDEFEQEDREFREHASFALALCENAYACQAIIELIVEQSVSTKYIVGGDIVTALGTYNNPMVAKKCKALLLLPKRKAIYRVARDYEKLNPIHATFWAWCGSKDYYNLFTNLYHASEERSLYHEW